MKDVPNAAFAGIFLFMALIIAICCLFSRADHNIVVAVLAVAGNIVTGAFAYIQGHKDGSASNPTTPADPAKLK